MADEAPAEVIEAAQEAPLVEVEAPATEVVSPPEEDGEPGGASPEDVRARKEYRTRKTVERELQSERIEKIRLEERVRAMEARLKPDPEPAKPRIYTPDEVQAAIDDGKITVTQGATYLARVEAEKVHDEREARREAQAKVQAPIELASREVNEYMAVLPWTKDQSSPEFKEVAGVYWSLVNQYGLADNLVTQRLALEKVAGPIQKIKDRMASDKATRQALNNDAHSETPAGGPAPTSGVDLSKAPAHMVDVWNKTGLSAENRKKEYAIWKQSHK